jgi:release factor glutamine methyltransferase
MKSDVAAGQKVLKAEGAPLHPSLGEALRSAAGRLAPADSPRLTAEALLAHLLGLTRAQLLSRLEQPLPADLAAPLERLVARAAGGEPLAYLTGHREFYGLDFAVDARVLVPRPETELLIDLALAVESPLTQLSRPHVLDVGTGSGALAVPLAVKCPRARLVATDISAGALAVACANAARHHVADRISFIQGDLLSAFPLQPSPASLHPFDLLVANLPYIPSAELRRLPVAKHEPRLALDGGPDGLEPLRRLLADAPCVLAPGGRLALEIEATCGEAAAALARAAFPTARVWVHQDLAGLDRAVEIVLGP